MLMRKLRMLISIVSLVAIAAIPAVAKDHDDDGDREHKASSMVIGGDFDLAVLEAGMVEASFVADLGLSVSSIEIRSEELNFGPAYEVEPGVWSATAFAPDGTSCYHAMADVVLAKISDSDREYDEAGDDDHRDKNKKKSRSHDDDDDDDDDEGDDDHRDRKKSRSHDDDDDRDDEEKHEASASFALRMGAGVCAPSKTCAPPVTPPYEPGPGPGLPPGVAPLPSILTPLGLYP